jgi:type VI secretion system protein ImpK
VNQDDPFAPFGDDDKTVLRPSPGGRRRPTPAPAAPPPVSISELPLDSHRRALFGENPLIGGALSLLSLVPRLRKTVTHYAIDELQQQLVNELEAFENRARQRGISQEHTRIASYALCSLLDETVLNTPWGAQSIWGHQSLLILFHKQAWGGEEFFRILGRLVQQPAQHLYLLELFYLCLSLGFEGKYRVTPNGLNTLEQTRNELYQLIQAVRGDFERALSPHWQGLRDVRSALVRYVPLWVVGAACGALLILIYLGFAIAVDSASDPVHRQIFALAKEEAPSVTAAPLIQPPPGRAERFRRLLAPEIAEGLVEVVDDGTLRIRNSFASGSDQVKQGFVPMLKKIAAELESGQDAVLVTGHTDNTPIFSARFPSNWHLSRARAKNVAEILAASASLAGKVSHEGRASGEPLAPDDSAEHRALNRRVELLIK